MIYSYTLNIYVFLKFQVYLLLYFYSILIDFVIFNHDFLPFSSALAFILKVICDFFVLSLESLKRKIWCLLLKLFHFSFFAMLLIKKLGSPLVKTTNLCLKWNVVCSTNNLVRSFHPSIKNESVISDEAKKAFRNFRDIQQAPTPALAYGIAGLIPFTVIPVYMLSSGVYIPEMAFTSMAYSAVILSFIGGVRWGSAVSNPEIMSPNWKNFTISITPSVIAWMSLLVSNPIGSILSITGFSFFLLQDITSSQLPSWYKSLRILLSTVAICALLTTLICRYALPLESKNSGPVSTTRN